MNDLGVEDKSAGQNSKTVSSYSSMNPMNESQPSTSMNDREKPHPREQGIQKIQNSDRHRRRMKAMGGREDMNEEQSGIYQPTLWWMTSTAFPLLAGTFGPIANLLSVCALIETWRVQIEDGVRVPDPPWLIALNAVSLFLALIANLVLMFNFARRIRYEIAQPITITLWYISSTLLIICIGLVHDKDLSAFRHPGIALFTQSYYYGLISSIIYFSIATLLLVSSLGAVVFHAYPPSFSTLTGPQRTLMLQTTSFSFYLALGAGVFSELEGWQFADGLYWADYTLLTIGLGTDFPLTVVAAKLLLIPYAAFGITLVGLVVSSVRGLVLERARAKVARRHLGKEREKWRKNIQERTRLAAKKRMPDSVTEDSASTSAIGSRLQRRKEEKLMQMPRQLSKYAGVPLKHDDQHGAWHRAEFELMRFIENKSEKTERYIALVASFFVILIVWIGGSLVFWACERNSQGWTYIDSFYFTYTTLLTIGYGDFYPVSAAGKPFFVVWSLISVPAMTVLISNMGDTVVQGVQEMTVWISQWTILPERSPTQKCFHFQAPKRKQKEKSASIPGHSLGADGDLDAEAQGNISSSTASHKVAKRAGSISLTDHPTSSESHTSEVLEKGVELMVNKIGAFERSEHRGGSLAARLAREISKLARDLRHKPPKRYSWDEWSVWLDLLGERDGADTENTSIPSSRSHDARQHAPPVPILPLPHRQSASSAKMDSTAPQAGVDGLDHPHPSHVHSTKHIPQGRHPDGHLDAAHSRHSVYTQDTAARSESQLDFDWNWTWLGDQGPLLSPLTETEWIIGKLCLRLEEVLEEEILEAHESAPTQHDHTR